MGLLLHQTRCRILVQGVDQGMPPPQTWADPSLRIPLQISHLIPGPDGRYMNALDQARVAVAERHRLYTPGQVSLATYQELEEIAGARGAHFDLRPGTSARQIVDNLVSKIPEEHLLDPSSFHGSYRPLSYPLRGNGWMVEELPGMWGNSPLPMLREIALHEELDTLSRQIYAGLGVPRDLLVEEHIGPWFCNDRAIQSMGAIVQDPPYQSPTRRDHARYEDLQLHSFAFVRDPVDPNTRIRPERVSVPTFELNANPTVQLRDISQPNPAFARRPASPPPPPKAHIFWPTSWEHLLEEDVF